DLPITGSGGAGPPGGAARHLSGHRSPVGGGPLSRGWRAARRGGPAPPLPAHWPRTGRPASPHPRRSGPAASRRSPPAPEIARAPAATGVLATHSAARSPPRATTADAGHELPNRVLRATDGANAAGPRRCQASASL